MRRAAVMTGVVLASVVALSRLATVSAQTTAQAAPGSNITFDIDSKVWVEGTSTVKSYKCAAKSIGATMQTGPEGESHRRSPRTWMLCIW